MAGDVTETIRSILASYIGIAAQEFEMNKYLSVEYEMDSTELVDVAKRIEQQFAITIDKFARKQWATGDDIAQFVNRCLRDAQQGRAA